jgi:hypothetical protein
LGIPTVVDRVAQQATKIVLEPIFEADFLSCSFGFRLKRSATQAMEKLRTGFIEGKTFVFETDIKNFFGSIDHERLMPLVAEPVSDRRVLKLLRQWLSAGVLEAGVLTETVTGTPQGGVMTPQTQPITGGSKGVIGSWDGVADGDAFGSDEDFFDHPAQYFLAVFDGGGVGGVAQVAEEAFQVLGQFEVGVAVEELGVKGVERALEDVPAPVEFR